MPSRSEPNRELTNPELSAAMQAIAAEPTPEKHTILYESLWTSTLILPTPESRPMDDEDLEQFLGEDEALTFMTFEDDAGGIVMIAFTDEDAALAWEPEGLPYIGLRGLDLLLIAAENEVAEIVLNPGSANAYRLSQGDILALAQRRMPDATTEHNRAGAEGAMVLIGPPEEIPPEAWQEAFTAILSNYPSITSAYLFQLHIAPQGPRHVIGLALVTGMAADAQDRVLTALLSEVEEQLPQGLVLELVLLDDPDFLQTVRDTVSALYTYEA
ncbi:MAG: SseB family protein [Anaerolineae bacterium]|nr:SseB family protein [Anaerolineae bacterium]